MTTRIASTQKESEIMLIAERELRGDCGRALVVLVDIACISNSPLTRIYALSNLWRDGDCQINMIRPRKNRPVYNIKMT